MKTLSDALQARHAAFVQKPAWLVQIDWSSPVRLSSYATTTYGGQSFVAADVDVSGITVDGISVGGTLRLGNADNLFGGTALSEGATDKRIRIWGFDAAATGADADFVLLADCAGGKCSIATDRVTISLRDATAFVTSPRQYVNLAGGFTHLIPRGKTVTINGQSYTIER